MLKYKIQNTLSVRHEDENGFLHVDKSPILRAGILEYLGSELLAEGENAVDGVQIDKDKIYKVYISEDELRKGANSFKMLPITNDHIWLGDDGDDAKDFQEGSIGENVYVEDGMLYAPLMFTGNEIIKDIKGGKKELSSSYYNRFEKSKNPSYDFIARDIKGNHLALVDKGRCGSDVRVLNSNSIGVQEMAVKAKVVNEAILKLDGKEIDLDRFFQEEAEEKDGGADVHEESIAENEDKRKLIDELMAIAGKSNDEFEGGEDEKVRTIAEIAEKIAYKPSETSETDNEEPKEEEISESENACSKNEEDDKEEEKSENGAKSMNYDVLFAKISNAIKSENKKAEQAKIKAYNDARNVLGDFNPFGMSDKDMYVKALNHLGVDLDGSEKVAELKAMLKACSSVQSKVDNGFSYSVSANEEVEYNI